MAGQKALRPCAMEMADRVDLPPTRPGDNDASEWASMMLVDRGSAPGIERTWKAFR
jgi:hypothetical protein